MLIGDFLNKADASPTLDEWVSDNALGLTAELSCHLKVFTQGIHSSVMDDNDRAALLRCILISIRQWDELRDEERLADWDGE